MGYRECFTHEIGHMLLVHLREFRTKYIRFFDDEYDGKTYAGMYDDRSRLARFLRRMDDKTLKLRAAAGYAVEKIFTGGFHPSSEDDAFFDINGDGYADPHIRDYWINQTIPLLLPYRDQIERMSDLLYELVEKELNKGKRKFNISVRPLLKAVDLWDLEPNSRSDPQTTSCQIPLDQYIPAQSQQT